MDDEASTCVALLHDVVEDTDYTFDDLRNEGFPKEIIDAIKLLTHDPSVPYLDYINKIKENVISTKVKLADLKHNSDLSRLNLSVDKIPPKLELYLQAIKILKGEI